SLLGKVPHDRGTTRGQSVRKFYCPRISWCRAAATPGSTMRQRDVPPPHEALERRAVNTEGLGRVADIPAVLREGLLEELLFQPLEGHLLPAAERVPVLSSASHNDLGKLLRRDNRSLEIRDGPFDDVLQLPHIAGQLVPGQQLQ